MTSNQPGRRVFDDENDRWIEVHDGETDRDALLRARRDGAPSVIPPRRPALSAAAQARSNRPLQILKFTALIGVVGGVLLVLISAGMLQTASLAAIAAASIMSTLGGLMVGMGIGAALLGLAAGAIIEGLRPR
ncbi:MAG TPA: hypothetical protein PK781_07040 [Terrimesophilobacter sp.]|nr:hypothetical protein [Terrimesophilobacter sp.]HRQ00200.1 hypothetical protein [Terrimesophilobacter sp.]